ncbi:Variable major outer membrane lipoprotein (plasmid) [Borrelia crocidurae DOU]|uniref:Variable large protein n=1 Tax=Borrelia crocidurae DOU TaxID=1293575 RepID=W5SJV1_9SPIR|nr:Variable major outer membrane lipoprotein [Borrelia crocidurae DOU]
MAANVQAGEAIGDEAAAIVSAVRGEEMLAAIVNATEDKAVKISSDSTAGTTALEFAVYEEHRTTYQKVNKPKQEQ